MPNVRNNTQETFLGLHPPSIEPFVARRWSTLINGIHWIMDWLRAENIYNQKFEIMSPKTYEQC